MTYINRDLGTIGVLDGGIIALNPLIVNKLGCVLVGAVSVGPIQGLPRLGAVRTRETAFPDTTWRQETWQMSADLACDTKGLAIDLRFFPRPEKFKR